MEFKVFVVCYTVFGFCMKDSMQECQTAPQKEILELMNNSAFPKTDTKRFVLAVPVINNLDKSEKRNKDTPIIALRVLKPKSKVNAVKDRNHETKKATKNIPPRRSHANDTVNKPLQNHKSLDDIKIKENDLNDNLIEPQVNKSIEFIHDNIEYVEKTHHNEELKKHASQRAVDVPEQPEPGDTNTLESPIENNDTPKPDIPKINPNSFHKQVHARSLEDKKVNIYEEADPHDTQELHSVNNTTVTSPKSIDKEKLPSVELTTLHTKDLNNTVTKSKVNDQEVVQNIRVAKCIDNAQNADCNKSEVVSTVPNVLIERKAEENEGTVLVPTRRKYDDGLVSHAAQQMEEKTSNPSTTHLYTHYQPPHDYSSHSQEPLKSDYQSPQIMKYHLFSLYNQGPSYASPVDYKNPAGIPYQYPNYPASNQGSPYVSPVDYNNQLGTSYQNPNYPTSYLGSPYANPLDYNNQVGIPYQNPNYPTSYLGSPYANPLDYNNQVGIPYQNPNYPTSNLGSTYANPVDYKNQVGIAYQNPNYPTSNLGSTYANPVDYNNQAGIPYQNPNYPGNNQGSSYATPSYYDSQFSSQPYQIIPVYDSPSRWYDPQNIAVYTSYPVHSNQANTYPQYVEPVGYDGNYYDSYNLPNAAYQSVMNVLPPSFESDAIKPDFTQSPPPYEYPFEKELSDLQLSDRNNYNYNPIQFYPDYPKGLWRIPKCNYNWYTIQCRYQPRSYRQYKYYYDNRNKAVQPIWRSQTQSVDRYYAQPYQIQSNQNLYKSQNKKNSRRKSWNFPK